MALSKISLNDDEIRLVVNEGWTLVKTTDGPEFSLDWGDRSVEMFPVIKRVLKPMSFRTQAQRYYLHYSEFAQKIGWGGRRPIPVSNFDKAISTFKIERFDAEFAAELTKILRKWTLSADPKQLVADAIERRKQARACLYTDDLIDYAYLGRVQDLARISLSEKDDGTEYLSSDEDPMRLQKALELAEIAT